MPQFLTRLPIDRGSLTVLRGLNLMLLLAFPVAWAAPLLRAGLLPFFDLDAISVLSGVGAVWQADPFLALVIALFALVAPIAKILALEMVLSGRRSTKLLPAISLIGRLAMADIFLIALYIVVAKGAGVGRVETGWGLYLFTGCVLASLSLSRVAKRAMAPR
ncbi:paraquat-inducible protein A [Albirhodobacter sp. R86504]|uniref:paraquat-inducible protein A n=1 Tax=Albirhodobacter sp. R86504 TaxID=3093848 RepID=UPI00366F3E73